MQSKTVRKQFASLCEEVVLTKSNRNQNVTKQLREFSDLMEGFLNFIQDQFKSGGKNHGYLQHIFVSQANYFFFLK